MNNQQKFLSELVELCRKHGVAISGTFAVWPKDAKDQLVEAILADVDGVDEEGVHVGRRSDRYMAGWGPAMLEAYNAGLEDGKAGPARPQRANGFDACYWQGWTHGRRK